MIKFKSHLFFLFVFLAARALGQLSEPVSVSYKFRYGDILTYQIEQQDSLEYLSQKKPVNDNTHFRLRTTMTIKETPPERPYTVQIKTDTLDIIHTSKFQPNLIEKEINQILHKAQEGEFKFDNFGHFEKNQALQQPVVFPFKNESIKINDIWHYKLQNKFSENGRYNLNSKVKCLVYDIVENQGNKTAIMLLNIQSKIEGHFKRQDIHIRLSGNYTITNLATHIVYFNINAGHVERIVSENYIEWHVDSNATDLSRKIKRRSTIKLLTSH